ncbi:hypothetical protein CKR_0022 [Clostridium kluyveri NBRC 12016]|uniref:Uncharacterized protein n=1 Tax=Clostridium kluyveri (strain NBRC 12016) TaxID=583346 RepID=B9DXU8_CLOK1|nr:hypothetical protein CKR_0022 [Clostridium kluyveri NBRC 12016]
MQMKVSPVPNHTINTCRFLYTGGFFDGAIQVLPIFRGFHPISQGSTPSFPPIGDLFNDAAEFILYYNLHFRYLPFGIYYLHASCPVFLLHMVIGY